MSSSVWAFAGIMAIAQFSPGPDMLLLTRIALEQGRRAAIYGSLGIATGLLVHATVAMTGCWIWMEKFPAGASAFRLLAAFYLLYLAARIVWPTRAASAQSGKASHTMAYLRGFFCNILNPKAAVAIASISAPFLNQHLSPWLLAIIIVAQGALLWCLWSLIIPLPRIRKAYEAWQRPISFVFAICITLLALSLLYR